MARGKQLVLQHLEDVSWEILEEYPEIIKDLIKRKAGVYALYKKDKLYYVGLATNLMVRLKTHLKDRHTGTWDRFSVYLTRRDDHIKELESLLLRIANPEGNRQSGKFVKSNNLHLTLNKSVFEVDADRRAKLLGGYVAKRRRKIKGKMAKGKGALKGLVEKRMILKGYRDGYEYTATIRKDGTIKYGDNIFDSPNAAARAALGRPAGGWGFWKYKNTDGDWVALRMLKK